MPSRAVTTRSILNWAPRRSPALIATARKHGLDVALDFAIQMSPDHPWLREHSEWFQHRPDGSLKYAENPPKRYQDIHNVDWLSEDREGLWARAPRRALGWCERGVRVYRVDNPHTKPVPFWEWMIKEVRLSTRTPCSSQRLSRAPR